MLSLFLALCRALKISPYPSKRNKANGRAISRVLSCAVICLARPLPDGSSGLPGARRAAVWLHFSLASDGACICPRRCRRGGSLLHCLFTLTCVQAVVFCCAFPRVAPAGRYPASCPVKPGLSSPRVFARAATACSATKPDCSVFLPHLQQKS